MKICIVIISAAALLFSSTATAQDTQASVDPRAAPLARRILDRIPDIPSTRFSLGRRGQRPARALEQARAILAASDAHEARWDEFANRGGWTHWNSHRDLPALIAAMAMRESYMQPIVRMDGGRRVRGLPTGDPGAPVLVSTIRRRMRLRRVVRSDMGVMQVRAPSGPARDCGVRTREDHRRLATDLAYGYLVGTCVMTNRVDHFVEMYTEARYRRLRAGQRSQSNLRFYGVYGPREGTPEAGLARELLVMERYNWGGNDFYLHPTAGGYARRVIEEFEFFRSAPEPSEPDGEG